MRQSPVTARIVVGFVLALIAAVGGVGSSGCNSTSSATGLTQACSLNSDCNNPLVCVFSHCHQACQVSSDCTGGARCVLVGGDAGTESVCQLVSESTCTASSSCSGSQVCSSDQQCRTPCQTTQDCPGGQELCLTQSATGLCYSAANPVDRATLLADGLIGSDGGVIGTTGADGGDSGGAGIDAAAHPATDGASDTASQLAEDASSDSTVTQVSDASLAQCDATLLPNGTCDYCPFGACAHGTCVSSGQDYSCQCYAGYSGTGTKTCSLLNSCTANNLCSPAYPCVPTASMGQACRGQFATWPVTDHMAAAGGPTLLPSFSTDVAAGVVTDQVTTLVWQLNVPTGGCGTPAADAGPDASTTCTVADAVAYCSGLRLGGNTDWRLPTKVELESLLNYAPAQPPYIETAFLPAPSTWYWTASSLERSLSQQWYVDFSTALYGSYYTAATNSAGSVRCVRGTGISSVLPAAHYTIHQGAIDAGAGDAAIVDDSVTDNWTGLTWERSANTSGMLLPDAQAYCATLGSGFRVPTLKELLTLVDPILFSPAIDTTTFLNTPSYWFWTSTPFVPANGNYYDVDFTDGAAYGSHAGAGFRFNVRCVH